MLNAKISIVLKKQYFTLKCLATCYLLVKLTTYLNLTTSVYSTLTYRVPILRSPFHYTKSRVLLESKYLRICFFTNLNYRKIFEFDKKLYLINPSCNLFFFPNITDIFYIRFYFLLKLTIIYVKFL